MGTKMKGAPATAEIFWTAFQALPKPERHAVFSRLVPDERFRQDPLDIAVCEELREEPSRPFRAYLKEQARKRR